MTLDESYCSPPIYKGLSTGEILKSNTNLALTNDYMLTEKHFSNSGKYTLLETEKKRWLEYIFDGNKKNADHSIIFSHGGIYRANDLHSRAQMINQMQSVVRSINQQVNYLLIEVESNLL